MRGTVFSRLRRGAKSLLRDQRGNAFMLTAAAIVPVIAIVGSGVDIGRGYMTQLRLQQACDAGVLAGRRAMAAGQYTAAAKLQATKMFEANFPTGIYGSESVEFDSEPLGATDVSGTAAATLPTAIMFIFGNDEFNLEAECAAKLEISNTDVMLVLDVTGSMDEDAERLDEDGDGKFDDNDGDGKPDPAVKRIAALKSASKIFFDTLTSADMGDGRLRFGMVPYASSVNVGAILRKKDPSWLSDYTLLPSRSPMTQLKWGSSNSAPSTVTTGTTTETAWTDMVPISGFAATKACGDLTPPGDSVPTTDVATLNMNRTRRWVDPSGTRVYSNDNKKVHYYYNYRYNWNGSKCMLQRRTRTFTQPNAGTAPVATFRNQYRYEDRLFDVSAAKTGSNLTVDTGDSGDDKTVTWSGCVIERHTSPFGSAASAPADALDMDIDSVPTADEATKWRLFIPEITYMRAMSYGSPTPTFSTSSTKGIDAVDGKALIVNSSKVSRDGTDQGNWTSYPSYWSQGGGVCPAAAENLTAMKKADQAKFYGWIDSLEPLGGTYHDAGMAWGIRLISPRGLFAAENSQTATGTNGRPISRHIIFMTDGAMAPSMRNFSTQGYEYLMQRVGADSGMSSGEQTARHNNRFTQLCERAKDKDHNITIWVIGFGVELNPQLTSCASSGKAYQTGSAKRLEQIFQSIAGQISRLRLSQ